jgi:hypothetical protein
MAIHTANSSNQIHGKRSRKLSILRSFPTGAAAWF